MEHELDYLCYHLGHDVVTHKGSYRQREAHIELTKISRLLMASEQGILERPADGSLVSLANVPVEVPGLDVYDSDSEGETEDDPLDVPQQVNRPRLTPNSQIPHD